DFQKPIRKRRLAMIDVRDDREVTDSTRIHVVESGRTSYYMRLSELFCRSHTPAAHALVFTFGCRAADPRTRIARVERPAEAGHDQSQTDRTAARSSNGASVSSARMTASTSCSSL